MKMADAQMLHAEKMAKGRISILKIIRTRQSDWKDRICFDFTVTFTILFCLWDFSDMILVLWKK